MAKIPHGALHRVFRDDPNLFTRTLKRVFDVDFPEVLEASEVNCDLTATEAVERRAGTILKAETAEGGRLLVIETRTDPKEEQTRAWAYYLSFLEREYGLPASLLMLAPKERTTGCARGTLALGPPDRPSTRRSPRVRGPDDMPLITEREAAAEDVAFAVLAVLSNRLDPDIEKAFDPLLRALYDIEPSAAAYWAELTEGGLGEGFANETWRKTMKAMPQHGYVSELRREGQAQGLASSVLLFLDERGVPLSEAERGRITGCADEETLKRWLLRAPTAPSAAELFED